MSTEVSERQSREVAEAAREAEWKLPSFAKELFLGRVPLRPDPSPAAAGARGRREGGAVPRAAARVPGERGRSARRSSATPRSRTASSRGSSARRVRDEGVRGVRRAGSVAGLLQPRAGDGRRLARVAVGAAQRPPVDRRGRAAADVRHRGAEAQVAAAGGQGPRQRLPAHRAGRGLRSRAAGGDGDAGGRRLLPQRAQAVGDEWRDRRHRGRHGEGAEVRWASRRDQRVRPALRQRGSHRRAP